HLRVRANRLDADAHVRDAVDLHHAVRALAGAAEEPARAVVLEAAREDAPARGEQGRADRVARVRLDRPALEGERHAPRAIDPLARLWRQPHLVRAAAAAGSSVFSTSFVRVSRSARNQSSQPKRWYHHSRWTPATFRRKCTYAA